ncbi:MAG: hypothetical protein KA204_08150 [Chromatiaceae bacterium]|nr:hypothetical protein [Chromatiaceae bacterium]MBP6735014.1 hypothetical protein [Chromatiaceae bacterium]MBP6808850.1 hypothetical protein [Chromatiaceae bacterium]
MPEETIALTQRALHRLKVVKAVTDRRLTQTEAGWQLGLTTRQVKRLVAAYRARAFQSGTAFDGRVVLVGRPAGRTDLRRLGRLATVVEHPHHRGGLGGEGDGGPIGTDVRGRPGAGARTGVLVVWPTGSKPVSGKLALRQRVAKRSGSVGTRAA